jgi:hypothetical protein
MMVNRDCDVDLPENTTHSFLVRVWLEETAEEAGRASWRGNIIHVANGERQYVESLDEIVAFIGRYLAEMGVGSTSGTQVCERLRQFLGYHRRLHLG